MDILTHTILTRLLIGRQPRVLVAGLGPDLPFYLTYPAWVLTQRQAYRAAMTGEWPKPPRWIETFHHAFHSIPIALVGAAIVRVLRGSWPLKELAAWCLHILVDIPTHSRKDWAPHFLWPVSDASVNGRSWIRIIWRMMSALVEQVRRSDRILGESVS